MSEMSEIKGEKLMGRSTFVKSNVKGKKILDIGCAGANGFMHRIIINNNKSSEVIGIDINIKGLKKLNTYSNKLILASGKYLPFKNSSFDCVYMGEVIEHFWHPKTVLMEVYRVLEKDGTLCLDTPNAYSLIRILRYIIKGKVMYWDPNHKIFYISASLSRLLESVGFDAIELTTDKKITFGNKKITLGFPPFSWLGSHLCVIAKK
jgi:ubiquinone/menaquinone biosynthesis C-methylase UbiE